MEVICIEEKSFFELLKRVVDELKKEHEKPDDRWVSGEEVMQMLRVTSKSTLQRLRDGGKVRFSQPTPKLILYDRESVEEYIEKHAKETF